MANAGQPTKYQKKYAKQLLDYFEAGQLAYNEDGSSSQGIFPTLARFACNLGVHRETLLNWANQKDKKDNLVNPEFFDAYKRAKDYQEAFIYEGAMAGRVNPTFAIWTAKVVLGHRDGDNEAEEKAKPLAINFTIEDAKTSA